MNIVIINHYAGGNLWGMEFRPYYLAKEWIKKGHQVTIVGASFSHLRSKQPVVKGHVTKEVVEGIEYVWLKTNVYKGNGPARMLSMLLFIIKLYWFRKTIFSKTVPELIIASSTYPLDNYPVNWLAKKYHALHCYEVHDLWPLSPMELGGYSKNHPFIAVMQRAENFAYKHANFVVSMLPKTLEHMVAHGLAREKFTYVPNGMAIDEWIYHPVPELHEKALKAIKLQHKKIVGYVGGHAISNALGLLIDAAALAATARPELHFVFVGDGAEKENIMKKASQANLRNIEFLPPVPKKCIPQLLSEMDILYLGWHDNPIYRFGISPNKLMDYMMAAKPVVHCVNAGNDIVADSGCGISVKPGNTQAIVNALATLSDMDVESRKALGLRGRNYVIQHNDYSVLAQKFVDFAISKMN